MRRGSLSDGRSRLTTTRPWHQNPQAGKKGPGEIQPLTGPTWNICARTGRPQGGKDEDQIIQFIAGHENQRK